MYKILASAVASFSFFSISNADVPSQIRVQQLKTEIREIANTQAEEDKATGTETRKKLDILVNELALAYPETPAAEQLSALAGPWKQLWSDDRDGESDFGNPVQPNKKSIFQYISNDGWFYNTANAKIGGTIFNPLTFLRGKYTVNAKDFTIEFTKVSSRFNQLKPTESISAIVEGVESGSVFTIGVPGGAKYPKGPVGAQGTLRTVYIDNDFRLATGENLTFNKDETHLYILDRADNLAQ